MRIAVPVWDERVSPVFDSAHTLLIVDIKNGKIKIISYESFYPQFEARLTEDLNHLGVDVFICGAISQTHSTLIETTGIRLIPFIAGNINEILEAFARGRSLTPAFLMPGCREDCPSI